MKRALVLSGGSEKGAFEVGAIDYLVNQAGFDFQCFFGTSIGALNAAILGQARSREELLIRTRQLKKLWLGLRGYRSIYRKNRLGLFNLVVGQSLYNTDGLRQLLKKNIDLDCLFDPATMVKVTTVALENGELFYADSRSPELRKDFLNYVLASASIPFYFPGVPIQGKHWYDGGLRDNTPLRTVFDEDPDEIVVITTYPVNSHLEPVLPEISYSGPLKNLNQMISIMMNTIAAKDLQLANAINHDYQNFPLKKRVPLRIVAPEKPFPQNKTPFDPVVIRKYIQLGYSAAQKPIVLSTYRF